MQIPRYVRQLIRDCFDEEQYQAGVSLLDSLSGSAQYQPDNLFALSLTALGPSSHRASLKRKRGSTATEGPSGLDFSKRDLRPSPSASLSACGALRKLAQADPQRLASALPPHVVSSAESSPSIKGGGGSGTGTNSAAARSPTVSRFSSVARRLEHQDSAIDGEQDLQQEEEEDADDEEGDAALSPLALKCDEVRRSKCIWDALDIAPVGEASASPVKKRQSPLRSSVGSRRSGRKPVPTRRWAAEASSDGSLSEEEDEGLEEDEGDEEEDREVRREIGTRWKRDGCWSVAEVMLLIWKAERETRERDSAQGAQPQPGNFFLQCGGSNSSRHAGTRGAARFQPASELGDALNFAFAGLVAAGGAGGLAKSSGGQLLSRHEGLRRARVGAALLSELSYLAISDLIDRDALIRGIASRLKLLGVDALEQVCLGSPSSPSAASSSEAYQAPLILAEALVAHLKATSEVHHSATDIGRSSPFSISSASPSPAEAPKGLAELCKLLDEAEGLAFLEPSQSCIMSHLPLDVRRELREVTKGSDKDIFVEALADLERVWPIERTAEGDVVPRSMLGSRKRSRSAASSSGAVKRSSRLSDPKRQQQQQHQQSWMQVPSKDKAERDKTRKVVRRLTAEMRAAEIGARLGHAIVKCGLVSLLASQVQGLALSQGSKLGGGAATTMEGGDGPEALRALLDGALQSCRSFAGGLTTSSDEASSCIKYMHTDPQAGEAWRSERDDERGGGGRSSSADERRRSTKRARTLTPTPTSSADLDGHPELVDAFVRAERGAARLRGLADALNASTEVLEVTLGCQGLSSLSSNFATSVEASEESDCAPAKTTTSTKDGGGANKEDVELRRRNGMGRREAERKSTTPPPTSSALSSAPPSTLSTAPSPEEPSKSTTTTTTTPPPAATLRRTTSCDTEGSVDAGAVAEML